LAKLADVLQIAPEARERILNAPAPDGGFSLAELQSLAATNGIVLAAVRKPPGAEIIVPCIVHWKIGHYSVITEKKGSQYRILNDQSVGVWLDAEKIAKSASGTFLVPRPLLPSKWLRLTEEESAALRAGYICPPEICLRQIPDDEDPPTDCCDDNDDQDADCDPPSANDGASDGGDSSPPPCCCDMGMPRWSVSQPYINLWLVDRPLLYKTSNNKWFPLKLTYKSRGVNHGTNSFGFGPNWECNWIAIMQASANSFPMMTNYRAGGGFVQVNTACIDDACAMYRTAQFLSLPPDGSVATKSSRGGMNHYGVPFSPMLGVTNYYMDKRIDRYGRTVHYNYQIASGVARLASVTDTDGNRSTIAYGDSNLVSSVTDPYGHTAYFYYMNGMLTNITDSFGMSSTNYYDTNGFITSMATPYGTTSFGYYSDTNNNNRALLVTEASGDHQLYSSVPALTASYHWNRAQYNAINEDSKTNYLAMQGGDYDKAELHQWLIYARSEDSDPYVISDTPWLSAPPVDPLSGYRPGILTFRYQGQTNDTDTGTLKRVTSISRDSVLQVSILRNGLGRPLFVTNYYSDGTVATIYKNNFDNSGRYLQNQTGPLNELVRGYGYHSVITNLLVSVTNAVGDVTRYTHDTNTMKVTSITFPTGLIRTNEYSSGFLTRQTDLGFKTNSFTYSLGNVAGQTDELGLLTTRNYDALNRLTQLNFPNGTTISNFYDKLDLVGVKDRLGLWTRYTYNSVRQLIGETNANGAVTTYAYCSCGSPSSITRWNGSTPLTDTFGYDVLGRITNATYADGYQLNYLYYGPGSSGGTAGGLLEAVSDSSGLTLALNYVQIGQQFKIWSAYLSSPYFGPALVVSNSYDNYGRLQSTLDRNGITVSNTYDLVNRLVTRVTLDQSLTPYATNSYVYDPRGLTNTVDALNHLTLFVRDAAGRLQYQTNANNEVLQFTYNPADEILTLTDGKNQTTAWHYNEFGWVTNKLDQSNTEILRYTYDPLGRLTNRWSAAKGNTKYAYDSIGNLLTINYPLSGTINYSYDSLNRLTNMIDAVGTTAFTYSGSGQLLTEDGPFNNDTVTSTYSSRMRATLTLLQPTGVWTNAFGYDGANRLNSVASSAGTFTYSYTEPSTRLSMLSLPNGAYVNNTYDTMSRLTNSFLFDSSSTPLDGHVYQYDSQNQRTNEVRADSSTVFYKYDNIGQLIVATSSVPSEIRGYTYDPAWNLNYRTNNGSLSTFIVDNKNQLTNSFAARNVYDSNGNMVTNNNNHNVLVYNDENQLTRYFHYQNAANNPIAGDTRTDFVYDGLGRMRKRIEWVWTCNAGQSAQFGGAVPNSGPGGGGNSCVWGDVSETWYVYDGRRVIQERDSNNIPTVSYTRGNDLDVSLEDAGGIGGLLARSSGYSSGNWTSHADYYSDGNGNVTSLIDSNQAVVASYRYEPFGNIISKSGSLANANVYRFSSKEVHVNSGMYYFGYRFCDPNLQRWINRDPLEEPGGVNLYGFVFNCPPSLIDPFGLATVFVPPGMNGPPAPGDTWVECPKAPPGVSLYSNMDRAEAIGFKASTSPSRREESPGSGLGALFTQALWFKDQVKTGGPWDYKNGPYPNAAQYEPFGNFNYGAAGHAYGWDDLTLQNEAGIANGPGGQGTPGPRWNPGAGTPPYGDRPEDNYWIRMGIEYAKQHPVKNGPGPCN
jgi:RHS repeat-associated protein